MKTLTAQNIGIDGITQYATQPTLWIRAPYPVQPTHAEADGTRTTRLAQPGEYDLTTFFNSFPISKWREYSTAKAYRVTMSVKTRLTVDAAKQGDAAPTKVTLTFADTYAYYPVKMPETKVEVPSDNEWHDVSIDVPEGMVGEHNDRRPVLFGVSIDAADDTLVRDARWVMDVEDEDIRDVELALCTTTFKKEAYIRRNADIFLNHIVKGSPEEGAHITLHITDNGRTLTEEDVHANQTEAIRLHPNVNSGGAGGFARGMIEAIEQEPQATHAVMMDDDISLSPESILRTYRLLRVVKDEYKEAFVSGAMMSLDEPDVRHEDIGFFNVDGWCQILKPPMRMSVLHDVVENEAFKPPYDDPHCQDQVEQKYQAWWYCAIPMTHIKERGLPLPLFVRYDDVEYSLRKPPVIMDMNGICVWHSPFFMRYDAAVERYQVARNLFIIRHASGCAPLSDIENALFRQVQIELKRFNYKNAESVLDGFEDFLKGPGTCFMPGFAEKTFMSSHKKVEKLRPIAEMASELDALGIDYRKLDMDDIYKDKPRSFVQKAMDLATFNGQRTPLPYTKGGKVVVCAADGGAYPAGVLREAETIVAINPQQRTCAIRHKDSKKFRDIWARYKADVKEYHDRKDELDSAYKAAFKKMTTVEAWKHYLGIDGEQGSDQ